MGNVFIDLILFYVCEAMASSTPTLAKGGFGKVYKKKYNGQWAAIKKIPCDKVFVKRKDLEREYKVYPSAFVFLALYIMAKIVFIHREAVHRNIVKLLGPITTEDNNYIIPLEFIFGEDLETTIFKCKQSKIQVCFG